MRLHKSQRVQAEQLDDIRGNKQNIVQYDPVSSQSVNKVMNVIFFFVFFFEAQSHKHILNKDEQKY